MLTTQILSLTIIRNAEMQIKNVLNIYNQIYKSHCVKTSKFPD